MHLLPAHLRGPVFMVLATGSYSINDTFMKLATEGLPPLQVLFLRGLLATMLCLPLVLLMGYRRQIPMVFHRFVLLRNLLETVAVLGFVIALAQMPIADITALGQITPLVMLLGASILFRERIGGVRMALIGLGFVGALMVAQPTGQGISVYALLGLSNAVFCAARDLAGRRVSAEVPALIVAFGAVLVVAACAGAAHLLFERWVVPTPQHLLLLGAAALFLIGGHFLIFLAYRIGPTGLVAPFYYCFTVWAVISGIVVFGQVPNLLALGGILLVVVSGLIIVALDERRRRLLVAAA